MFSIRNNAFSSKDGALADFTGLLIHRTTELRNPDGDRGCCGSLEAKFAAELSYLVLMVASVVEHVVRVLLCLVAVIPSLCFEGGFKEVKHQFFYSLCMIFDHPTRCAVGLFKNVFQPGTELKMKDLTLCEMQIPDEDYCACAYDN
jgi:hypothetical protein